MHALDFPIIDTHVHLWNPDLLSYPWLHGNPVLARPFLLADFDQARTPIQVEQIVFLQCDADFSQFMQEAAWVTSLAEQDNRLTGIVPWAPLEEGDHARPHLEQLAANPRIKGVRRILQSEEQDFCLRPDFVRGVQALADYGLSFDICIFHRQLPSVIELVKQCPDVPFILDHIGKPDIRSGLLDPWRAHMRVLADFPKVWCKLSGLVTEADHTSWRRDQLKPYIDHVIDCFSFNRVIYGGDWPVATLATDYPRWVETLSWAVAGCSDAELRLLFRDNAISFYRLSATI